MSLIVTSNVNLNDRPSTSEIHKPYNWSNRLTSTFKIEKDSEIAVQSVKINKNGLISIGEYNSNYAIYLGKTIGDDGILLEDSTSHAVADAVVRSGAGIKDVTTEQLSDELEASIKKNLLNPSFYSVDNVPNVSVTVKTNATTSAFEGYNYSVAQDPQAFGITPGDTVAQSVLPTSRFTYVGGVFTRTDAVAPETNGTKPRGACAVFPDFPVTLSSSVDYPSVNYDITDAIGDGAGKFKDRATWAIGLTRNSLQSPLISPTTGEVTCFAPPYYDQTHVGPVWSRFQTMFFDFCAIKDPNGILRIYQSCVDTSKISGDQLVMREVIYYGAHNTKFATPYNLDDNLKKYTHIRFRVENEGVVCEIGKQATAAFDVLVDTTLGNKTNMFYPRSILQNFLYPQIFIQKVGTAIGFEERYTYANIEGMKAATGKDFDPNSADVDFVARLEKSGQYIKWGKPIENREHNDFNATLGTVAYGYEGFEAYSAGGTLGGYLSDMNLQLILAPNKDFGLDYTADTNSQFTFGFTGSSSPLGNMNANGISAVASTTRPILTSSKSLFIRVNNLTQQSVNAQLGNAYSKIISHLPRFDSAGNEVGQLYFEPNELVYVSLNNPNEVFINSFDIDIVYDNETYADCLSGKTIVVLHIRQKK